MNATETRQVEAAADLLARFLQWVQSERVVVGYRQPVQGKPISIAYVCESAGMEIQIINKEYGSSVQLAEGALKDLRRLLTVRGHMALNPPKSPRTQARSPAPSPPSTPAPSPP